MGFKCIICLLYVVRWTLIQLSHWTEKVCGFDRCPRGYKGSSTECWCAIRCSARRRTNCCSTRFCARLHRTSVLYLWWELTPRSRSDNAGGVVYRNRQMMSRKFPSVICADVATLPIRREFLREVATVTRRPIYHPPTWIVSTLLSYICPPIWSRCMRGQVSVTFVVIGAEFFFRAWMPFLSANQLSKHWSMRGLSGGYKYDLTWSELSFDCVAFIMRSQWCNTLVVADPLSLSDLFIYLGLTAAVHTQLGLIAWTLIKTIWWRLLEKWTGAFNNNNNSYFHQFLKPPSGIDTEDKKNKIIIITIAIIVIIFIIIQFFDLCAYIRRSLNGHSTVQLQLNGNQKAEVKS